MTWSTVLGLGGCATEQNQATTQPQESPFVFPISLPGVTPENTPKTWNATNSIATLRSPSTEQSERRAAAQWLLSNVPGTLAHEFEETRLPSTREIILQSLAASDEPLPDILAKVLLDALGKYDGPLQSNIAQVLARSPDVNLQKRLLSISTDNSQLLPLRRGAMLVLGNRPDRESVSTLFRLTDPKQPPAIREAAANSLRLLLVSHGSQNNDIWQPIFNSQRNAAGDRPAPEQLNVNDAMASFSRLMNRTTKPLEVQLADAQDQIYRLTPVAERPAFLVKLLSNPVDSVRLCGMKLVQQRLNDGQLPERELIVELEKCLGDNLAKMREQAAIVLRNADDQAAARMVAQSLVRGIEKDPDVLKAYLRLVSRFPQTEAVVPALELLPEPLLEEEAAGAIASAQRAGMLSPDQQKIALSHLRNALALGRMLRPRMIPLLALLGREQDWVKIQSWLDHPDAKVKESAATVWMEYNNAPVIELARRVNDPVISAIALQAATNRGDDAESFEKIVDFRPTQDVMIESWRRCLIAMSARVPAVAVAAADQRLTARGETASLREAILTAVITHLERDPAQRSFLADFYITRAEVRLASDPKSAAIDLRQTNALSAFMNDAQKRRREIAFIRTSLANGEVNNAMDSAKILLAMGPGSLGTSAPDRSNLLELFVLVAERSRASTPPQTEQARSIGQKLREMVDVSDSADLRRRIDALAELSATLPANATIPATAPATMPAPATATPGTPPVSTAAPAAPR